jgi:hypothetical protein
LRMLCAGEIRAEFFLSLAILWTAACIASNYAALRFSRKLIPS